MKGTQQIVAAAILAVVPCAANAQAVISERTLSMNAAQEMANAALEACRKEGYKVTITVLNRAGRTLVVLHDDGANPHTLENSFRKAYTSLTFRVPSGEFGKRMTGPGPFGQLVLANVTPSEGALPVIAGKDLIGTIGISGAPGGHRDAACAQVGIDRIASGLK